MISATIITLNEERSIVRAIKSLKDLADEIIVIDSGSSDKTVAVAKNLSAKVFFRKFDNFAAQKNWAVLKATGDWILALDADEEIPLNLSAEIKSAIKGKKFVGFLIPRRNFILGGEVKYSRWSPDKHIWLWKKEFGKWVGEVHEEVVVTGPVGELKNAKLHYQNNSVAEFIQSNDFYSTIYARSLFNKGLRFSLFHFFGDPFFEFFIRFVYKLGFLDGWRGFILSYLMTIYKISIWIKIYELQYLNK